MHGAELEVFDGVAFSKTGDTFVTVWKASARLHRSRWLYDLTDSLLPQSAGVVALLVVLPTSEPPDRATRIENSVRLRRLRPSLRRLVTVVPGDSFRMSIIRSVVRGMALSGGIARVHTVQATLERGVMEMRKSASGVTPSFDDIRRMITEQYEALDVDLDPWLADAGLDSSSRLPSRASGAMPSVSGIIECARADQAVPAVDIEPAVANAGALGERTIIPASPLRLPVPAPAAKPRFVRVRPADRGRLGVRRRPEVVSGPSSSPPPERDGQLPPTLGGRYRPVRLMGRGGTGSVYEVEHLHTGQRFALKLISERTFANEQALERFRREARVCAGIRCENVVRVIDADVATELHGAPYLVMDLLEGADLGRLCGDEPQPPERVVRWLRQVACALDQAHAAGVVHRDLKPENVFVTQKSDGSATVRVLDFGFAKSAVAAVGETASGEMLGTPRFMAPEQADPHGGRVTASCDLFALGLLAHKLLTGRHYWQSQLLVPLVREICFEPMPAPSERGSTRGASFDAWFARACDRDPARRFRSAGEQIEALSAALGTVVASGEPGVSPSLVARRMSDPRSRRRARLLRLAVAAMVLLTGAWLARAHSARGNRDVAGTAAGSPRATP